MKNFSSRSYILLGLILFLEVAKRHAGILILVVEEHDVGVDDINETSGIHLN